MPRGLHAERTLEATEGRYRLLKGESRLECADACPIPEVCSGRLCHQQRSPHLLSGTTTNYDHRSGSPLNGNAACSAPKPVAGLTRDSVRLPPAEWALLSHAWSSHQLVLVDGSDSRGSPDPLHAHGGQVVGPPDEAYRNHTRVSITVCGVVSCVAPSGLRQPIQSTSRRRYRTSPAQLGVSVSADGAGLAGASA